MRKAADTAGWLLLTVLALALAREAGGRLVTVLLGGAELPRFLLIAPGHLRGVNLVTEVAALAVCGVVPVLWWKLAEDRAAQSLALLLLFGLAFTSPGWRQWTQFDLPSLYGTPPLSEFIRALPGWLALAAFLRFSAVFPDPLVPDDLSDASSDRRLSKRLRRLRRWTLRPRAAWILGAALWAAPFAIHLVQPELFASYLEQPDFLPRLRGIYGPAGAFFLLITGVSHLRLGYRRADEGDRQKILWLLAGMTAAGGLAASAAAARLAANTVGIGLSASDEVLLFLNVLGTLHLLAAVTLVASLLFALFYQGALSPKLVIRKSTLYGLLTAALLVVFSGVETVASAVIRERLAAADTVATTVSGAVVALLFKPAESFLERKVEEALPDTIAESENNGEAHSAPAGEEKAAT